MANLHQFSLGKRVIKKGRVQCKQRRGNRLQRCEFTCINRSAIVFLETKYEKPSISKIAAEDGAGSTAFLGPPWGSRCRPDRLNQRERS